MEHETASHENQQQAAGHGNAHAEAGHGSQSGASHETSSSVGHHPTWEIGPLKVHADTLITTWTVMAIIMVLAAIGTRALNRVPDKIQSVAEAVIEFIEGVVKQQIGPQTTLYLSLIGTFFLFVLISNWSGLLPWVLLEPVTHIHFAAPTTDLNTTAALAVIAVASYFFFGIKKKGLRYFKHYITPHPAFLPMNLMEDFTRPLSLAFRLFGNMMGEHIVALILLSLILFPLPMFFLGAFFGLIQAYIFTVLAAYYIGAAVADHGHGHEAAH